MLFLLGHIFQIVTINLHYFTENKVDKLLIILCYSLFFLAFYLVYCTVSIVYCSVYIHNKTREWYLYCSDSEASSLYNVCVALTNVITVLFSYRNREAMPVQYIYLHIYITYMYSSYWQIWISWHVLSWNHHYRPVTTVDQITTIHSHLESKF